MKDFFAVIKADAIQILLKQVDPSDNKAYEYFEKHLKATEIKLSDMESRDVALMVDSDPYQVIVYRQEILNYMKGSWVTNCCKNAPIEFLSIKNPEAQLVAYIIKVVYHELRHVYSAIFESYHGRSWYDSYMEASKDSYEKNKYEVTANSFQLQCLPTVKKFIDTNQKLIRKIEWP